MMRVDGREVAARGSVLDVCRAAGAGVPALCFDERLSTGGHCRACLVEMDGRVVAACATPARDGAVVLTDTPALRAYRRDLGELLVSESTPGGAVGRTLALWGVDGARYGRAARRHEPDASHAWLRLDLDACILCRRCVRACEEIQGEFVYAVAHRGADARVAWAGGRFADSGCVACGACVAVCPTGAISDVDRAGRAEPDETVTRTTCGSCAVGCALDVHATAERVVRVEGSPAPPNRGHLCARGRYGHAAARGPARLTTPLVRRGGKLEPAAWDEALAAAAAGFARAAGAAGAIVSAACTNEEMYLAQKWARAVLGTNDVDCADARAVDGLREPGGALPGGTLDDLERAEVILVVGADATESHPVAGARIRQAALRGARLVVVDARATALAALADQHLAPRAGDDVALIERLTAAIAEEGAAGGDGAERAAARLIARAARLAIVCGPGADESAVRTLGGLARRVRASGRAQASVIVLGAGANARGATDMGCRPDRLPGAAALDDAGARARCEAEWGRPLPARPGRRASEMLAGGALRALLVLGEDVATSAPDPARARAALEGLECLVVVERFLTATAERAHVVLPGADALEKEGTLTSAEGRIGRVRRVLAPPGEARADGEILLALLAAGGLAQPHAEPAQALDEIARLVPAYAVREATEPAL